MCPWGINLMRLEGESFNHAMILRGSLERLSPVLMTALVTAFALAPLLFEAERKGTEILHPTSTTTSRICASATAMARSPRNMIERASRP